MPSPSAVPIAWLKQGQWMASVCNACRYCESLCATFPALERRLSFAESDLLYLSNLCHNCGACYAACQYAPPHEYQVNFPRMMAELRGASYRKYVWPSAAAALYERNGTVVGLLLALCLLAFMLGIMATGGSLFGRASTSTVAGDFYAVMPHAVMVGLFGAVALFDVLACSYGLLRFWKDTGERLRDILNISAHRRALGDALSLRYLGGGDDDEGCELRDAGPTLARRRFHHLTFYGFLSCFAATCVATLYHYGLGQSAPYPLTSLPVVLGSIGGVGLVIGPLGLLWVKFKGDAETRDAGQTGMNVGFIVLLILSAATGLVLLVGREGAAMPLLLAVHLAVVMALFLTMPYGKFMHGLYRYAALVRYALERSRPAPKFSSD